MYFKYMKTLTVREMKAHWAEIENRMRDGETFLVLNRGKPAARILPPAPSKVLKWDDHLKTGIPNRGRTISETISEDRHSRF